MDTKDLKPRLNAQILEEAADWLVEFGAQEANAVTRQKFDSWLRASPEHVRAYLELVVIWEDGAIRPLQSDVGPDALIALARRTDNVIALAATTPEVLMRQPSSFSRRPRHRVAWAASVVLVCLAAGALTWLERVRHPTYSTQVGEQRLIDLSDGSAIELNARSKVRIRFTAHERNVDLLEGQALFRVAKNSARPFIVASDGARVRAVGTEFDVYRKTTGTTVTVLEGRVSVARDTMRGDSSVLAPPSTQTPILLSPGEQVTVTPKGAQPPAHVNLAAATAWMQRQLVFDDSTLTEVVEEFNRYNTHRLVIRDAALRSFPVSARFSSTDPASLIRFLQAQPAISVVEADGETQICVRR